MADANAALPEHTDATRSTTTNVTRLIAFRSCLYSIAVLQDLDKMSAARYTEDMAATAKGANIVVHDAALKAREAAHEARENTLDARRRVNAAIALINDLEGSQQQEVLKRLEITTNFCKEFSKMKYEKVIREQAKRGNADREKADKEEMEEMEETHQ